jgi:hypothetical protein
MKTAQKEATTPINAIMLFPSKGFLRSNIVILKITRAKAITINMVVKIFIVGI